MFTTSWFVHPANTGCLSGKDAGSLVRRPNGVTMYRAPTGTLYRAPCVVPFGDQGAAYVASVDDVQFVSRKGSSVVQCERVWRTTTDHYVGAGEAGFGGGLNDEQLSVENDSIDTFNVPNNDAFNTMMITAPMYREPYDASSTSKPITAPFYSDMKYQSKAPSRIKDCCHYGVQTASRPSMMRNLLIFLLILVVVFLVCRTTMAGTSSALSS